MESSDVPLMDVEYVDFPHQIKTEVEEEVSFPDPPETQPLCFEDQICSDLPTLKTESLSAEQGEFYDEIYVKQEVPTIEEREAGQFVLNDTPDSSDSENTSFISATDDALAINSELQRYRGVAFTSSCNKSGHQESTLFRVDVSAETSLNEQQRTIKRRRRTKKRERHEENWIANKRKQKRQHGESYIGCNGTEIPSRKVGNPCLPSCKYQCSLLFSQEKRNKIHSHFWSLSNSEKTHYYTQYVEKNKIKRRRNSRDPNKRKCVYIYHFEQEKVRIRVCQQFFCQTLNVSSKRIYRVFNKMTDPLAVEETKTVSRKTPASSEETSIKEVVEIKEVTDSDLNRIREHITLLTRWRSVKEMREMFVDANPQYRHIDEHIYGMIFDNEFNPLYKNLSMHVIL